MLDGEAHTVSCLKMIDVLSAYANTPSLICRVLRKNILQLKPESDYAHLRRRLQPRLIIMAFTLS